MAMTYTALVGLKDDPQSIKNWTNYNKVPPEVVLTDAQSLIYSHLRCREMRASTPIAFDVGDTSANLPSDFLDPIYCADAHENEVVGTVELKLSKMRTRQDDGTLMPSDYPRLFAIYNEQINLDVAAETGFTLTLWYFKRPLDLASGTNEQNFLTRRYPAMLRFACLWVANLFRQDDAEIKRYQTLTMGLINDANAEAELVLRGADMNPETRGI